MIKFTMGSSDAKKTPRRKPKRSSGKSYPLPSSLSGSSSNPTGQGSSSQAPTKTVVNGCFQNTMPTSTNTFMHSLGDSLAAYSQWQQTQEGQTMQKSGRVKAGEVLSNLPFTSFYLNSESCFVCHRPKIGNGDLTSQFESDSAGVDVSAYPQLWVCIECQQSFDRGGVDPMASDLQEEILLDPPSSPVLGEISESVTLNANSCNCSSCTETRQMKEQNENFEQELQQYLYEDLRQLAACIYRSSLPSLAADAHEGYQLSHIKPEKMHDLMQRFYCQDPQRLFQCLESWVEEFIIERRSGLFVQLPATGQQMTVSMASHLVTSLLNEYSCFCVICQHLMSSFDLQENPIFKGFQLTIELHHKYLFHRLIYSELQKYLTNAVALISLQSTKLRKENAAACNFYSQLLQEYAKLQEEMSRVLMEWQEYCQLTENGKQELVDAQEKQQKMMQNDNEDLERWSEIQKQTGSKLSETETVLHVSHEGTENHLMERVWQDSIHESNKGEVNFSYPNYGETCMCKCDLLAGMVCSESSGTVTFPGQLLLTSCSQTVSFKNSHPSVSNCTRLSSSGSASPDDNADDDRVLTKFIRNPRDELCSASERMNGRLQIESKEEDEDDDDDVDDEEDDEEDDDEEYEEEADEQDALHNSSPNHRIAELNDSFRKTTNSDENNSSDEGDDEDDDYEDDLEIKVLRVAIGNGILRDSELSSSQASEAGILSDGSPSTGASASNVGASSASGDTTASTSGSLFAFAENHEAQTTAGPVQQQRHQQQQPPPCQCSSCVSQNTISLSADLPQQPLMPSLSSLSIYPHIHGPTTSGLQALGRSPCASRTSPRLHAFPLQRQQGDGMEQLIPKVHVPESEGGMFPSQTMLSEWELQNSSFFMKQNNYGKVLMASNGSSLPFTTLSLASNAGEVLPNVDGGAWFKLDRPVVVTHSCVSSSKGVVMSSSGAFSGMTPENHVGLGLSSSSLHSVPQVTSNEVPLFPLSMSSSLPVAKYGMDQQPYCFQLPLAPLPISTSAAAVFSSSSSFYQIAAAPALFVQPQNSCQAISISSTTSTPPHGLSSPRLRTDLMPAACMNGMTGVATKNSGMSSISPNGSAVDVSMKSCVHPDHRASMASSSTTATPLRSDTMAQFSLVANGYPSVNFNPLDYNTHPPPDSSDSSAPLAYHHTIPCQRSGSSSLPPAGSCEDQHSSGYCKSDSQQDEEGFNSQDESGSSSSNQKDGKYCDCWHCEVFGHSTPLTLPTSKNYAEMRDRLRLRLKKKQNEQRTVEPETVEEKKEAVPVPVDPNPPQQEVPPHLTDIEELLKFINGEDEALEKSKAKAAKRSRQKLRKLQQKAKDTRSDENSRRSCGSNKRKNASSPGTSHHLLNHCTNHSCSSHKDPRSHPGNKSKDDSGDMEDLKLLNVLNSMNFNRDHLSRSDKSKTCKTNEGKTQSNGKIDKMGVNSAVNSEEERGRRGHLADESQLRVTASGASRPTGNCISEPRSTNDLLRQSSSHCLLLGKLEGELVKKAKAKEAPQLKSVIGDLSEAREPSRVEEGMKPVTISSEEGMRTILASPLLQAELAKNKPLQKLFMQAVQQQKQSREKQESRAAAASLEAEAEARSQRLSTEQRDQQQQSSSKPDPMLGKQAADQSGSKQKPQIAPQGRTRGTCKLPQNQLPTNSALGLKSQVTPSQSNAIPEHKMPQPTVQSGLAKEGKLPQEPSRVSEGKPQQLKTLSHCSNTQASQTTSNGKTRPKPQQQQQVSGSSSGNNGNKDQQQSSSAAPKNKLHLQNPPDRKQMNGLVGLPDETIKRPTVDATHSNNVFQSGRSLLSNSSSANADVKSKSECKKTAVGFKKNKKACGQPVKTAEDEARFLSEKAKMLSGDKKSSLADVNNTTRSTVNCTPELETYLTTDRIEKINPSTAVTESSDATSSENNQASNGAVGGAGATAKSKKSKRKNKSKNSLSVVDEIFMPKDVPGDCHLDENEREIEEFKRFCSKSAPSENRKKVNLNNVRELFNKNVKDLFNKKKTAAASCQ